MSAASTVVRTLIARGLATALIATIVTLHVAQPRVEVEFQTTRFQALAPKVVADTRAKTGFSQREEGIVRIPIRGRAGVPRNATAVSLTVSVIARQPGHLTLWPADTARPDAAAVNFEPNVPANSTFMALLGDNGAVDMAVPNGAQVVLEVTGAFTPAAASHAGRLIWSPRRVADTRTLSQPLFPGETRQVSLSDVVPATAIAAFVTVSTDAANRPGLIRLQGTTGPASDIALLGTIADNVTASATGLIALNAPSMLITSSGGGHIVIDLVAYFTGDDALLSTEGLFVPIAPRRIVDSRNDQPLLLDGVAMLETPPGMMIGNLAITQAKARGFTSSFPTGSGRSPTYALGVDRADQTASTLAVINSSARGYTTQVGSGGHLIFDQTGTFTHPPDQTAQCGVSELLVPDCGAWFGASTPSSDGQYNYQLGLAEYERVALDPPDVLHFYKRDDDQFPTAEEVAQSERPGRQRSLLMYNWKPSTTVTWRAIADGAADQVIDATAQRLKAYRDKLFLGIYHEPENDRGSAGSGMTPADYIDMYRHVVDRLRSNGVTNVVYVMTFIGYSLTNADVVESFYPGDDVVDWIAYDPYGLRDETTFDKLLNSPSGEWPGFYEWATNKAPGKPIMLGEWGFDLRVRPDAASILTAAPGILAERFAMVKALLYWNDVSSNGRIATRLDGDHPQAAAYASAYAALAADPYFASARTDLVD